MGPARERETEGYTVDELVGRNLRDVTGPGDEESDAAAVSGLLGGEQRASLRGQGYAWSRPVAHDELPATVAALAHGIGRVAAGRR
jgi:hypothetical protein